MNTYVCTYVYVHMHFLYKYVPTYRHCIRIRGIFIVVEVDRLTHLRAVAKIAAREPFAVEDFKGSSRTDAVLLNGRSVQDWKAVLASTFVFKTKLELAVVIKNAFFTVVRADRRFCRPRWPMRRQYVAAGAAAAVRSSSMSSNCSSSNIRNSNRTYFIK